MIKILFLIIGLLALSIPAQAHSGRLDSQGGHRVNKEWTYEGQYIEIENNQPHLEKGKITFKPGDYHYHCRPSANKIDLTTYRDGIYIPAELKEVIVVVGEEE